MKFGFNIALEWICIYQLRTSAVIFLLSQAFLTAFSSDSNKCFPKYCWDLAINYISSLCCLCHCGVIADCKLEYRVISRWISQCVRKVSVAEWIRKRPENCNSLYFIMLRNCFLLETDMTCYRQERIYEGFWSQKPSKEYFY